jgi:hypothetical protein
LQRIAERVGQVPGGGLEARGVKVGDVIPDDVHLLLEGIESADG